jgi:anti-anti-sigma factor
MNELAHVESESIDSCLVVRLDGEVDASNAAAIGAMIAGLLDDYDGGLVVDLSGTEYLDSAGIRMLFNVRARLERAGHVACIAVPTQAPTRQILRIAEVEQLIPIAETAEDAVRLVKRN